MKKTIRLQAVLHFAKPPRQRKPRPARPDLFGGFAVTPADVDAWLRAVPRIDPLSPRARAYVENYNVVGKIIEAKRRGEFMRLIAANEA